MKPFLIAMTLLAASIAIPALLLVTLLCLPRRKRKALESALYPDSLEKVA